LNRERSRAFTTNLADANYGAQLYFLGETRAASQANALFLNALAVGSFGLNVYQGAGAIDPVGYTLLAVYG
jgi:hypothetical protein